MICFPIRFQPESGHISVFSYNPSFEAVFLQSAASFHGFVTGSRDFSGIGFLG
jgi:hypothetical protein